MTQGSVHGVIFQISDLEGFVRIQKYLTRLIDIRIQQDLNDKKLIKRFGHH